MPLFICGSFFVSQLSAAERATVSASPSLVGDIPLKVHQNSTVHYPVSLLHSGITHGEAQVLVAVDADGKVTDTLVAAYTHQPFAETAVAAIRTWRYDLPRVHGEVVSAVVNIQVRFETEKVLVIERSGIPVFQQSESSDQYEYKPLELRSLDSIPTPVSVTQPIYPKEWIAQGLHGKVTVDFYIDETGTVRMPSVVSTEHPLLAAAATAAVRSWRFAPPLRKGRPVLAHCQQVFTFEAEQAKP